MCQLFRLSFPNLHPFRWTEACFPLDGSVGFIGRKGAASGIIRLNSPLVSVSRLNGVSRP